MPEEITEEEAAAGLGALFSDPEDNFPPLEKEALMRMTKTELVKMCFAIDGHLRGSERYRHSLRQENADYSKRLHQAERTSKVLENNIGMQVRINSERANQIQAQHNTIMKLKDELELQTKQQAELGKKLERSYDVLHDLTEE